MNYHYPMRALRAAGRGGSAATSAPWRCLTRAPLKVVVRSVFQHSNLGKWAQPLGTLNFQTACLGQDQPRFWILSPSRWNVELRKYENWQLEGRGFSVRGLMFPHVCGIYATVLLLVFTDRRLARGGGRAVGRQIIWYHIISYIISYIMCIHIHIYIYIYNVYIYIYR